MNVLAVNVNVFGLPRLDHASLGFLGHRNVTVHIVVVFVVVVSTVAIMAPRLREVMTLRFSTIELS